MLMSPDILPFDKFEFEALRTMKPFKSSFRATWFHEAGGKAPKRNWLIKDLILAKSFGIIYGPPGCGKSFLLADMMLTCAAGAVNAGQNPEDFKEWFEYKANPFGVVYVVAEGADDFVIRLHAWRLARGVGPDEFLPFVFLPSGIDLRSDTADTERLKVEIAAIDMEMRARCGVGVGAVVIDTVSRALAGGNENDSSVMGAFVRNCEDIGRTLGVALIGVHHGGKEAGKGPRGHESLLGAADFVFEVAPRSEDQPLNSWTVRKFKAGAAGGEHRFKLQPMTVDEDEDGDKITSCTVISQRAVSEEEKAKPDRKAYTPSASELEFLRIMSDTIRDHGHGPPTGDEAIPSISSLVYQVIDSEVVKRAYIDTYKVSEAGTEDQKLLKLGQRWARVTKSLIRNHVIRSSSPYIWMSGKAIKGATVRGVNDPSPQLSYGGAYD